MRAHFVILAIEKLVRNTGTYQIKHVAFCTGREVKSHIRIIPGQYL